MPRRLAAALVIATLASRAGAEEPPPPELIYPPYFPINVGIMHPLAANASAPELWTHLDLSLILGRVGFVDGVQLGPGAWTMYQLRGVQLAAVSVVGARVEGLQLGAAFAYVDGSLEGLQLSGVLGWTSGDLAGIQVAGVGNQILGDLDGLQLAGGINVTLQQIRGAQLAGLANIGRVEGLQVGAFNVSAEQLGLQVGAFNVSRTQRGLQLGIINIARNIDGLQIGVVNITDNLDGESIGLIPIPRRGGIHPVLWSSNSLLGHLGVRFASRYAYSLLSVAFHGQDRDDAEGREVFYTAGFTIGARVATGVPDLSLSADLGAHRVFREALKFTDNDEIFKLRVMTGYTLAPRLTPFLGAGLYLKVRGDDALQFRYGPELFAGIEL